MTIATVNGADLYYDEGGAGVPCIALHGGLGFDHSYLKRTLGPLEDHLRMTYVDQRGNGRSQRVPLDTITMRQLAADVDGLREHLGLDRVAVLGHSYGGFVALEYATTYPDRLSHLLLVDTSPGRFEPTPSELAERRDDSWMSAATRDALATMFRQTPTTNAEFEAALPAIAPAYVKSIAPERLNDLMSGSILEVSALVRGFAILPEWSVADKLKKISCPTLVVCGRYDVLTTPECAKRMATAIRDAELLWLENSGHFPWLEEPDEFFSGVKDWLARHPA